ncbi:hypothetical protein TBLA_0A06590 [Henningerozyma blattae CBS 6284]|uniref:Vacuolar import and degradation protein 24 n=1 Tax=Henningerozyma blattae (strain ATCC 34711 / CBS 6284 / DSM 70876 / NBRC 10599 / NRRL Y-10934 / UCD 77-7) TaxID=1071380 RepID=I2GWE9_HENB6|nr:hypothetical protein TBLA_0A06590 [Tetrapisispora blattae CBS 6284]CCH58451.1 hypothetical protein TBLA_0A06590 [Tetrapisispora blattae CBS 6284]
MINESSKTALPNNTTSHLKCSQNKLKNPSSISSSYNSTYIDANDDVKDSMVLQTVEVDSILDLTRDARIASLRNNSGLYKLPSNDSIASFTNNNVSSPLTPSKSFIKANNHSFGKYMVQDYSPYNTSTPQTIQTPMIRSVRTNYLRPNMRFTGYQISGYKRYQVSILLKTVDLPSNNVTYDYSNPHLSGYLSIKGLTNQYPEITTFFESFVIDHVNLSFLSNTWNSYPNLKNFTSSISNDLDHWFNFTSFKNLVSQLNLPNQVSDLIDSSYVDKVLREKTLTYLDNRFIFMRWKEKFLVPDSEIDNIEGASFEGFYYIVHDQYTGNIKGFYYHKDAEKFQQLDLIPDFIDDKGGNEDYEFA